jgi:Arc/MetJ family transcription regulator
MLMARTTVDVDEVALMAAQAALGTSGLTATINAALREIARRSVLADFDVRRDVDGTPGGVEAGRETRDAAAAT